MNDIDNKLISELSNDDIQVIYSKLENLDNSCLSDFIDLFAIYCQKFNPNQRQNLRINNILEFVLNNRNDIDSVKKELRRQIEKDNLQGQNVTEESQKSECSIRLPAGRIQRQEPEEITQEAEDIGAICSFYVRKLNEKIWPVILGKSNMSEFVIEVIQIVAPAIAQQYAGLPAMAIVAVLTIMCRNGITLYLTGNKNSI